MGEAAAGTIASHSLSGVFTEITLSAKLQPVDRILANGNGAIIIIVVVIEGLGCRCETDTQNDGQGRGRDLETSQECSHARSIFAQRPTERRIRREGGMGPDGMAEGRALFCINN